ncbi:GPO family capsid scaffolding protein [Escherichia coli]|nr:phage capsid protein [Escherichia coli]
MPQPTLMTDWTCIATSGPTADGREIDPQWLIDAAETYSRNTYTAMLWPCHENDTSYRQYTFNLGEVDALKVETREDGKTRLYARLVPNQYLIEANRLGQKLFTSAELIPNFAKSGRDYLMGVAVTDTPASLGTEKIRFTLNNEEYTAQRANCQTFTLGSLSPDTTPAPRKPESFLKRLFSAGQTDNTDTSKPDTGEDAKMDEIKALLEKLITLVEGGSAAATGEGTADTPEEAKAEVAEIAAEIADAAAEVAELAEEVKAAPEDEVKAEAFTAAKAKLEDAIKAFSTITPEKGERYRRFAARRQADTDKEEIKAIAEKLNDLTTKLSATGITPRPAGTPAESEKPFDFV